MNSYTYTVYTFDQLPYGYNGAHATLCILGLAFRCVRARVRVCACGRYRRITVIATMRTTNGLCNHMQQVQITIIINEIMYRHT